MGDKQQSEEIQFHLTVSSLNDDRQMNFSRTTTKIDYEKAEDLILEFITTLRQRLSGE